MMRVTVTGGRELTAKLKKLGDPAVVGKMLENALVAGALVISNSAKEKAPYKTGNLRRSIHVGGHTDADEQMRLDMADTTGHDLGRSASSYPRISVQIGTDVEYAAAQEYGGRRPYLRPAMDENKAKAKQEFREALADQLAKKVRSL